MVDFPRLYRRAVTVNVCPGIASDIVCSIRGKYEGAGGGPGWSTETSKKIPDDSLAPCWNCSRLVRSEASRSLFAEIESGESSTCLTNWRISSLPVSSGGAQADGS